MRILLALTVLLVTFVSIEAQVLISDDTSITDTLIVLLEDVSITEMQVEYSISSPLPSTAATRKVRMRGIYEARVAHAKAQRIYFTFCAIHAPDEDTRTLFSRKAWAFKRRQNAYQNKVYAYTTPESFNVQRYHSR